MPETRFASSVSRSMKEGARSAFSAAATSRALAARISGTARRNAAAAAVSALFFCSVEASASTRAAARASRPMPCISCSVSVVMRSGAFIAVLASCRLFNAEVLADFPG
jgi:hypothetical protein